MGTHGVYYRKKIAPGYGTHKSKAGSNTNTHQPPVQPYHQPIMPENEVVSAHASALVDQHSNQLLDDINSTIRRQGAMAFVLPLAVVSTLIFGLLAPIMFLAMPILWLPLILYVDYADRRARTYSLMYELSAEDTTRWNDLNSRLGQLSVAHGIWRKTAFAFTDDWKRNAGAQELVQRKPTRLDRRCPAFITSNLVPWCLTLDDQSLFFFPDRILVAQGSAFGAVDYDQIAIQVQLENFVESGPLTADAEVIGHTYTYVNKDGSPDRRFSDNRQIPIVRYAHLIFSSTNGLNIHLQVSSHRAAFAFAGWTYRNKGGTPATGGHPNSGPSNQYQPPGHQRPPIRPNSGPPPTAQQPARCYVTLGLMVGCTQAEAIAAYHSLAKQYHPDLTAKLGPELQALAAERMKEINVAFVEIKKLNCWV